MFFNRLNRYAYENTRQFLRIPASWPVKCHFTSREEIPSVTQSKDISAGGIRLSLAESFPPKSTVHVEIFVPPLNRTISTRGEVVRCLAVRKDRYELGIRFLQIDSRDRDDLDRTIQILSTPRDRGKPRQVWWRKIFCLLILLMLQPPPVQGEENLDPRDESEKEEEMENELNRLERAEPLLVEPDELPGSVGEEEDSLMMYLRKRIHIGLGFDEEYKNNIFLERDNQARHDYISTIEGEILYADPRGALLYGLQWEFNAFRYHKLDANAIDHDATVFLDLDTGGRLQWGARYAMGVSNRLFQDPVETDLVRTSTDFQRSVQHTGTTRFKYQLNELNYLVPTLSYTTVDDQTVNDASTDKSALSFVLDLDHHLAPRWVIFAGYYFDMDDIPGFTTKESEGHAFRLGTRYNLTQISDLDLAMRFGNRKYNDGVSDFDLGILGKWKYDLSPRTSFTLNYTDQHDTSAAAGRRRSRGTTYGLAFNYDLSPLTRLTFGTDYSKRTSSSSDALAGSPATSSSFSQYTFNAGLAWQWRESTHVNLEYELRRSKTGDLTNHVFRIGLETEI